jgi:hypothetical protein
MLECHIVTAGLCVDDASEVSPVNQVVIDLAAGAADSRAPGFEMDSFVHEVRAFDRHLTASKKIYQSEAVLSVLSCKLIA